MKGKIRLKPKNTLASKVSVSIPAMLTKRVDGVAKNNLCSRSAVIVAALEACIDQLESQGV